jgi:hypothetical protein
MIKSILMSAVLMTAAMISVQGQPSPAAQTSVTIGGKQLAIKYSAPSVKGRQMFGDGGRISKDPTYPVWRAGANSATAFHTDADLDIKGLHVPAGDYTIFVLATPEPWQLIVNKQTKQWGLAYKQDMDLGRVTMDVSKPSAPIETFKITLSSTGGNAGKLQLEFENYIASVPFTVK